MSGKLTLILGPMKSGKTLSLISLVAPLEYSDRKVLLIQPDKNVRDVKISSRVGAQLPAVKTKSLRFVDVRDSDVVAIDEVFMFDHDESALIERWLKEGRDVIASGLDLSGMGRIPSMISRLYRLGPDRIVQNFAVCELCRKAGAQFTQIRSGGEVVADLPDIVPEDGTYEYLPVCRDCR